MPIVHMHLLVGRPAETKASLARELTAAVTRVLGSDPERVQVLFSEYETSDWSVAGEPMVVVEGTAT